MDWRIDVAMWFYVLACVSFLYGFISGKRLNAEKLPCPREWER